MHHLDIQKIQSPIIIENHTLRDLDRYYLDMEKRQSVITIESHTSRDLDRHHLDTKKRQTHKSNFVTLMGK